MLMMKLAGETISSLKLGKSEQWEELCQSGSSLGNVLYMTHRAQYLHISAKAHLSQQAACCESYTNVMHQLLCLQQGSPFAPRTTVCLYAAALQIKLIDSHNRNLQMHSLNQSPMIKACMLSPSQGFPRDVCLD